MANPIKGGPRRVGAFDKERGMPIQYHVTKFFGTSTEPCVQALSIDSFNVQIGNDAEDRQDRYMTLRRPHVHDCRLWGAQGNQGSFPIRIPKLAPADEKKRKENAGQKG
eukprot:1136348-Pelagomonas_calceolata.AAC.5